MKALLWREWRLTRVPLLIALCAQLAYLWLQTSRTYSVLLEREPSLVGLLLAAWLAYHRFYAEQRRGTWLLQPFSRTQLVLAKLLSCGTALLAFALIESLSRYAWVATSSTPGGPILSLVPYLEDTHNVALGTTFALFFSAAIASFSHRRWVQVVSVAGGLAWVLVATASDHQLHALNGNGDLIELPTRTWHKLGLAVIACLGVATLVMTAREFGHRPSALGRVLHALWRTPVALFCLLFVAGVLPEQAHSPRAFDSAVLLRDGEIVMAHFLGTEVHATRQDGSPVRFSPRWSDTPDDTVSFRGAAGPRVPPEFGMSVWSPRGAIFVAEDARTLLIFSIDSERQIGCWGANGLRWGASSCAPTGHIIDVAQVHDEPGEVTSILVTTEDGVFSLDDESHDQFRGSGVHAAEWVGDEGEVLAVFTETALQLRGRIERTCPPTDVSDLVGVLSDDTVVTLGEDSLTYCREAGEATTVPWPSDVTEESHDLDLRMGFLLPLAFDPFASRSTWWLAAMLRLLGGALVIWIARKRGLLHALIGLVLGPGYLLAALVSEIDLDTMAICLKRITGTSGSR